MTDKLPIELEREPLLEAVFEVRLEGCPPLGDILPGALLTSFEAQPQIARLPAAEFPFPVRSGDPNLMFQPVQRLEWERFQVHVGDRNIIVGCKLPYPKWPTFCGQILEVMEKTARIPFEGHVVRYSMKYINIIEAETTREQLERIDLSVVLGGEPVSEEGLSLRVQQLDDDILHIISIVTGAQAVLPDGQERLGVIVDVDSIQQCSEHGFKSFVAELPDNLDRLRHANKAKFFSCLNDFAIAEMRPHYE